MIFNPPIAVKLGNVNGPVPVQLNTRLEEDVVVKLLAVPAIYGPDNVNVLLPTANVPAVNVKVPLTVGLLFKLYVCPLVFIVRLLIAVKLGSVNGPVPVQLNTKLEVELEVTLFTVPEI